MALISGNRHAVHDEKIDFQIVCETLTNFPLHCKIIFGKTAIGFILSQFFPIRNGGGGSNEGVIEKY